MPDMMTFPDTVEEFMYDYKVVDTEGIYMSKGAELVPIFRMKQWFEHVSAQPEIIRCKGCKYFIQSNEKCELIDTRLRFYETDKTWAGDCFCAWAERREDDKR